MERKTMLRELHPVAALCFCLAVLGVTVFVPHPALTLISLIAASILCLTAYGVRETLKQYLFYLPTILLIGLINPLFSHSGSTYLLFVADMPYTLGAMLYGFELGLMISATLLWCRVFEDVMTGDRIIYLFGRIMPRGSLVIASVLRYIPRLRRTLNETKQAQISLGAYKGDNDIKSAAAVYSSLIARSLESSIITSDSMSARGYGLKNRSVYAIYKYTVSDAVITAITVILCVITLSFCGGYDFYPTLNLQVQPISLIAFALLSLTPTLFIAKEALKWQLYLSKI